MTSSFANVSMKRGAIDDGQTHSLAYSLLLRSATHYLRLCRTQPPAADFDPLHRKVLPWICGIALGRIVLRAIQAFVHDFEMCGIYKSLKVGAGEPFCERRELFEGEPSLERERPRNGRHDLEQCGQYSFENLMDRKHLLPLFRLRRAYRTADSCPDVLVATAPDR